MLPAMTRQARASLLAASLALARSPSARGAARPRLRAAGRRERLHAEAARQGQAAHGGRGATRSPPKPASPSCAKAAAPSMPASPRRWCSIWSSRNPRASAAARFCSTWDAAPRRSLSFDGRETAPAAATPELFLDAARQAAAARGGHGERAARSASPACSPR